MYTSHNFRVDPQQCFDCQTSQIEAFKITLKKSEIFLRILEKIGKTEVGWENWRGRNTEDPLWGNKDPPWYFHG